MRTKHLLQTLFFFLAFSCFGFSQKVKMITDWKQAKAIAQKEDKKILVILTGTEWCAPCKKMDKGVITNAEFKKYAENNLVLFLIDIPGTVIDLDSKVYKDYKKFKKKYAAKNMPSLILTDKNGIKIKNLKGKLFKLKNVMKQLTLK